MLIKTVELAKKYKNRFVVDGVNIEVNKGEIVGLLGPNGAGKSTTFYMIAGLIKPDAGKVFIGTNDVTRSPTYERAKHGVGYLPQEPSIFRKLSVEDNIMAILEAQDITKEEREVSLNKLLAEFNITKLRKHIAYTLSGGERRRLEITRALVTNPSLILLDEPFSGVDPIAVFEVQKILQRLKAQGLSILLTDHSVRETLSITDRSYLLFEGKVEVSGTSEFLASDPKAREIYLGERFTLA